jgi:beta-lactamase superfamily II metal-dependent hydrolase
MFRFHVVQAEFGDCLFLEYGRPAKPRFTLIDGGPPKNFDVNLAPVLKQIAKRKVPLDLAVLSHVDNDHVVGMVDYFAELQAGASDLPRPKELWHNSWGRTIDPQGVIAPRIVALMTLTRAAAMPYAANAVLGISEGNSLRTKAKLLDIPINAAFPNGDLITVGDAGKPVKLGNLRLTVVGPTQKNLDRLRKDWLAWIDKHEDEIGSGDAMIMANSDRSVPNLSSIMLVAEADGKTILLTGDGRSDHLLDGLEEAGLLNADGRYHVDILKLAHHGSERDVTREFFELVTADTYVASANGKDGNPDLPTLEWIADTARESGRDITIIVTNRTPSVVEFQKQFPATKYPYHLQLMPKGDHAMVLTLAE